MKTENKPIVMNDVIESELQGLTYIVNLAWGGNSPDIITTIKRAKALLEAYDNDLKAERAKLYEKITAFKKQK